MEHSVYKKVHELQLNGWWFGYARNRIVVDILIRHLNGLRGQDLLDVGCSEGAFLEFLKSYNVNARAIDNEETAIAFCRERGFGNQVQMGSILDIPIPDCSFDIVTCLDVIEHVDDDHKAFSELFRVCRGDGVILMIVPAHQWLWSSNDDASHHRRRYSKKALLDLINRFNVTVEVLSYFNMFLFPVFVLFTFWKHLFPNKKSANYLFALPKPINWFLSRLMEIESFLISKAGVRLPFGSSTVVMVRRLKNV
jgi:SAM-dependent methyltransferase